MQLLDIIPYNQYVILHIFSYYDKPLTGLCVFQNSICYFKNVENPDPAIIQVEEDGEIYDFVDFDEHLHIFKLNLIQKFISILQMHVWNFAYGYAYTNPYRLLNLGRTMSIPAKKYFGIYAPRIINISLKLSKILNIIARRLEIS